MTDIIVRLRRTADFVSRSAGKENSRWIHEAADEIERLRALVPPAHQSLVTFAEGKSE